MILKDSFQQKFRISTQKLDFEKKIMGCFDTKKFNYYLANFYSPNFIDQSTDLQKIWSII